MQVRCVKLLKPYAKKSVDDDDDDDEDDEDYTGEGRAIPPVGRIMEHDVLSQAYHIGTVLYLIVCFFSGHQICHAGGDLWKCCVVPLQMILVCVAVLACGSKGIPQSGIGLRMNVGKLESRMICRRLERAGLIKVR